MLVDSSLLRPESSPSFLWANESVAPLPEGRATAQCISSICRADALHLLHYKSFFDCLRMVGHFVLLKETKETHISWV